MLRNVMRLIAIAVLAVALVSSAEAGRRKGFVRATWERRMLHSLGFDSLKKLLSPSSNNLGKAKVTTEVKEEKAPLAVVLEPVRSLQTEADESAEPWPSEIFDDFDASLWASVPDDVPAVASEAPPDEAAWEPFADEAAAEPLAEEEQEQEAEDLWAEGYEYVEPPEDEEALAAEGYEFVEPPAEDEKGLAAAEEHSEEEEEHSDEEHSDEEHSDEEEHFEEEAAAEEEGHIKEGEVSAEPAEEEASEEHADEEHSEEDHLEEEHSEEEQPAEEEHSEDEASEEHAEAEEGSETEYEYIMPAGETDGEAASQDVEAARSFPQVVIIKYECPPSEALPGLEEAEEAEDSQAVEGDEEYEYVPTPDENPEDSAWADSQTVDGDEDYEYVPTPPEDLEDMP